jgi:ubiquinone/menaquinone biosynthesis C-methylase UbiE
MKDYYEELWRRLPPTLEPPELALRRRFMLGHVGVGDRALDLGCGDGRFTAELAGAGATVLGVDVAEAALERARARNPGLDFQLVETDADLPLADNSFDLVWASEVIEHISDTARWLSEVRRVLVPRGRLLITTPSHGRLRVLLGGMERFSPPLGDHLHLYTRSSLRRLLEEFGFAEVSVRTAGGVPLWRRFLLADAIR